MPGKCIPHDFIEKFSKKYESEYIDMLGFYKGKEAFKTVHAQIAKQLSTDMKTYGITKSTKGPSEHVFGDIDMIQWWEKI